MSDPRFARLKCDPRFRRPRKKNTKVVIDDRFKSIFDQDKTNTDRRKVDKYGRPISKSHHAENLRRYYQLENNAEDNEDDFPAKLDRARGEVLLESSDEENLSVNDSEFEGDDFVVLGPPPSYINASDDHEAEIDLNEDDYADLNAQAASYSRAHPEEKEAAVASRTSRLAMVNLDWDHVRANHLYKICSSLVSATVPLSTSSKSKQNKRQNSGINTGGQMNVVRGKVLNVRVYPSNFGKERMAREEKEGPPSDIFKKKKLDPNDVNEQTVYEVGGEDDYDENALRKYQLERLRYFYAIVTCDSVNAASHIYNELEGTELERSANVFDISFVADDMTFENELRDEATDDVNTTYKAVEFVTDALRHSKVKLTWDDDDPERNDVTRRALTRREIEESDFKSYVANGSSESESEAGEELGENKGKKMRPSRKQLRSLFLGGNEESMPEGWGHDASGGSDIDMEVTFTPGLSVTKGEDDETTLERYQRKIKEKKTKKKEERKQKTDEFFEESLPNDGSDKPHQGKGTAKSKSFLPHTTAAVDELSLVVSSDISNVEPKHFNMKAVIKSEKRNKTKRNQNEDDEAQEEFVMDVKDERFRALFDDHRFAIDPTNPHYKKTKSMSALLDERQKRQRNMQDDAIADKPKTTQDTGTTKSLQYLVESVKRKSANVNLSGHGKRRKL